VPTPKPALSIVIPAYNEERRLGATLQAVLAYCAKRRLRSEVLVVDDGSKDGTCALALALAKKHKSLRLLAQPQNWGKGAAVKAGVLAARGAQVLFTDADLSTPIEELAPLQAALRQGADIAIGSRAIDRSRISVRQPFYREAGGRVFNQAVQLLSVRGIQDTQCGFKLLKRGPGQRLFTLQQVPRFGFDVELLYLARKAGYRIAELPVRWVNSPESKVRPVRDGLRTFFDLALIRLYDLQGRYQGL
jgi:dolichyl-phosphate beta-glucosyltransferase